MRRLRTRAIVRWVVLAAASAVFGSVVVAGAVAGPHAARRPLGTIAFLRHPEGALTGDVGGPSLFVIKADGTGLRRLTPPDSEVYGFAWSPDGSRIAYTDRSSLWLVRRDGSGRRRLFARQDLKSLMPTWSPEGKSIGLYVAKATTRPPAFGRLYIVPTNGGAPRRLGPDDLRDPSWSPRGDKIAYASPAGQVSIISIYGTDKPRIVGSTSGCFGPAWSANGQRLAMACGDRYGRHAYIDVVNANGRDLRRLTKHAYNEYGFRWSPDGRAILYGKTNGQGIYVIGADGRNDRIITTDSPPQIAWGALTWSPDGRSIAYVTHRTGYGDIYVIDADGRKKTQVTNSAEIDSDPAWAPG